MQRMTIGDFAHEAGLTPKALRLYDEMGLVVPAEVDGVSGYRYYGADQLDRARLVARLRLVGMPLARIRLVVDLPPVSGAAEVASYWRQVEADSRSRRTRVHALVAELRAKETRMSTRSENQAEVAYRFEQGGRDEQLDAVDVAHGRWVVADGCGAGARAADAALSGFLSAFPSGGPDAASTGEPTAALDGAVVRAHDAVASLAGGDRVASTLTAAWLLGESLAVAHIGDSRAWLLRDGELTQLTQDHTEVQSLLRDGLLTEDEARTDPRRQLLNRALAESRPAEADVFVVPVRPDDRLVLTTDGVHAVLEPAALAVLLGHGSPQESVDAVAAAVEEAGAPDNYAVVVGDVMRSEP